MSQRSRSDNPLMHVQLGMRVMDVDGNEIGTVTHIYLGQNAYAEPDSMSSGMEQIIDDLDPGTEHVIVEAFSDLLDVDELPAELVERMLRDGYLLVDPNGPLGPIQYILSDQIASVSEEGVYLAP